MTRRSSWNKGRKKTKYQVIQSCFFNNLSDKIILTIMEMMKELLHRVGRSFTHLSGRICSVSDAFISTLPPFRIDDVKYETTSTVMIVNVRSLSCISLHARCLPDIYVCVCVWGYRKPRRILPFRDDRKISVVRIRESVIKLHGFKICNLSRRAEWGICSWKEKLFNILAIVAVNTFMALFSWRLWKWTSRITDRNLSRNQTDFVACY